MYSTQLFQRISLIVFLLAMSSTSIFAQDAGQTIIKRGPIGHDYYGAGQSVYLGGAINGDAVIAGQRLTIDGPVSGDVLAAGESITLNGEVQDDVRAAGRLVLINAGIGDHVVAAAESLTLGPKSKVGGWAWLAGRQVEVLGQVGQDLRAAGEEVIIAGVIKGNVTVMAERVRVLDGAVIHGDLNVQSPTPPKIADGAHIMGSVKHIPMPKVEPVPVLKVIFIVGLLTTLGLMLTGIVYFLLFPHFSVQSARHIEQVPLACLGLGFLVLFFTPLVIALLFATGIGVLLGILLAAAYLLMVVSGGLTGAIYVSDVALRRLFKKAEAGKGLRVLMLIGAFVLLGLVQIIPLLGGLAVFLLSMMGIGALKYQFWRDYKVEKG